MASLARAVFNSNAIEWLVLHVLWVSPAALPALPDLVGMNDDEWMMRKKVSLIFLKLCTLKVHVKLIFFNFENCDVTIFNYEKNRFLCRNFGNFCSKTPTRRGLFFKFEKKKNCKRFPAKYFFTRDFFYKLDGTNL